MGITLILCKESWRVLWTLFTQGGHEYRGSRQFLSFLISLAYPDQLRLKLPRPGCHRNQGKGIGQSDVSKKLPNILRCDFLMDSCVRVCMLSHSVMSDCVTRWTVACQAPVSMGFPRQEYWSGLPFPFSEDLPNPGAKPESSVLAGWFFTTEVTRETPSHPLAYKITQSIKINQVIFQGLLPSEMAHTLVCGVCFSLNKSTSYLSTVSH